MRRTTVLKAMLGAAFLGTTDALAKPVEVSIQISDEDGTGLNGTVAVTVTASPVNNLSKIDLLIDSKVVTTGTASPLNYQWDTKTVADGTHTLDAVAQYKSRKSTAHLAVTVNNAVVPPPPPPPVGTPLFDGQATRMTSITGSTIKVGDAGWAGSSNASQDPWIWGVRAGDIASGVYCMTDSCRVIADPKYGKVFRFNIGPGDTNPYFDQPTKPNGELTIERPLAQDQVDWYAESFKIIAPYAVMSFNVICQYGYPSLASPPLSISFDSRGLGIDRHVGILIAQGDLSGPGTIIDKPRFWQVADVLDKWVEMVIGVKWNVTATGWIEVWARVQGEATFTQKYVKTNTPTWQQVQGQSIKTKGNDKMGLYFGTSSSPPTNTVLHRGFTRWGNKDDAIASMG